MASQPLAAAVPESGVTRIKRDTRINRDTRVNGVARINGVTRGGGLLESWLARLRADQAERLIPDALRSGAILDIGCGRTPYFLARTEFASKIGLDRDPAPASSGLKLIGFDLRGQDRLPAGDGSVSVVTMLAVFEHLPEARLLALLDEIDRVLIPGGVLILTTPAGWTAPLLDILKAVGLVSAVEIEEHEASYSIPMIRQLISRTRLAEYEAEFGTFELGMNIHARFTKR